MLRLPAFDIAQPTSVADAVRLLAEHADALVLAGGTDLVPNMKHALFTPSLVVSLARVAELRGIREEPDGALAIGAMTTLAELARSPLVAERAPALAQAASLVAGPQLRRMGTLGGNVMLDTRCQWYNQTYFWRQALGFCLKKDGTECHVVAGGQKCVAAASNDTAPALMSLGAELVVEGPGGARETRPIDDFYLPDGIHNKKLGRAELLVAVRVPRQSAGHHGAYGKLRDRGSIDFPLFGVAARLDVEDGTIAAADLVAVALQARPTRLARAAAELVGAPLEGAAFDDATRRAAERAYQKCRPMPNIPGDHDYRREMVPVYVRRTLHAAARGDGPVHHV